MQFFPQHSRVWCTWFFFILKEKCMKWIKNKYIKHTTTKHSENKHGLIGKVDKGSVFVIVCVCVCDSIYYVWNIETS